MATLHAEADAVAYRTSPTARQVIDGWLAKNPASASALGDAWDVGNMDIYHEDRWQPIFAEMRKTAPVNKVTGTIHGDYWNVCTLKAIQHVEALPEIFSSSHTHGGVSIIEPPKAGVHNYSLPMFIAMDRPQHTAQRRTVAAAFTPAEMLRLREEIRDRTGKLLDALPIGEQFDWVDRVSVDLTTSMLAILFDFPREDQHLLTFWSDWITSIELGQIPEVAKGRVEITGEMSHYFQRLWKQRSADSSGRDLLSIMARSEAMGQMDPREFMGNLMLLITGGNDTTRNTMSGFVLGLDRFPEQRAMLEADPSLAANAVPEIIRFVSPVIHMRRTATQDAELLGEQIKAGDKVVLWYISANHDESIFDRPERLDITRHNARHHVGFGYGIHRCIGARLAELQLRILVEEMTARRLRIHVTGDVKRSGGAFLHGIRTLEVEAERY